MGEGRWGRRKVTRKARLYETKRQAGSRMGEETEKMANGRKRNGLDAKTKKEEDLDSDGQLKAIQCALFDLQVF